MNSAPTQGSELDKKEHLRFQRTSQMSRKSNTRVYKLKNYGNPTLRVESAPVAQWSVMVLTSKRLFLHPCIMILLINATYYSVLQGLTFVTFQRVAASLYRSNHSCSVFSNESYCKTFMVFYGLLNCAENSILSLKPEHGIVHSISSTTW